MASGSVTGEDSRMAKLMTGGWRRRIGRAVAAAAALAGIGLVPSAASAGLGESADSVRRDHTALGGTALTVRPGAAYDVHETATPDGARIRQYVSHGGTVFAVAWSARTQPDLRILLAQRYPAYVAAASARRGNHHVLSFAGAELTATIVRHPRGFTGTAFAPALMPDGVAAGELR
jgi:hypothetical protein